MKNYFLILLFLITIQLKGNNAPERIRSDKMVNDYAGALSPEQEENLELLLQKFKIEENSDLIIVLTSDIFKTKGNEFATSIASEWNLGPKSFVIVSDLKSHTYGFFRGAGIEAKFPNWILEKIESNHLRVHFRKKEYYDGLNESTGDIIKIYKGTLNPEELKKEDSDSGFFLISLILVLAFFIILFPILQYRAMKKSHMSAKPLDFVSTILLMNSFGTRGKNVFDNFSRCRGSFAVKIAHNGTALAGGGGAVGSW